MSLENEIKTLIISSLELEDITTDDIKDDEPLLESQTHRRRADNTQANMTAVIGFSYSFKPAPPNGERKKP